MRSTETISQLEQTEVSKKYDTLIKAYEDIRPDMFEFGGRFYTQEKIYRDADRLNEKLCNIGDKKKEFYDSTDDDKALEAVLFYTASHGQLFASAHFGEASSEFDDLMNGADTLIGIPGDENQYDTVASIDACSCTSHTAVARKFAKADNFARRPLCGRVDYYEHNNHQTILGATPHYILGVSPAHIAAVVDKFNTSDPLDIKNEVDEPFRRKILIEIFYQSMVGRMACNNAGSELPKKSPEWTKMSNAWRAHKVFHEKAAEALCQSFGIDDIQDQDERSSALIKTINEFHKAERSKDPVFASIVYETDVRYNQQRHIKEARAAKRAAAIKRQSA